MRDDLEVVWKEAVVT